MKQVNLIPAPGSFQIKDDSGEAVKISSFEDSNGLLYWYRRLKTPVCLTGECKLIDIGIYWNYSGDFFGLEVYDEHLTKTDHSVFSEKDYQKLISVLSNDWSILREFEPEGLLDDPYEETTDGSTGATKKEIADESVSGAVYTTYTIWHLVYVGENEQLVLLTLDQLKDPQRLKKFMESSRKDVRLFLLEQVASGFLPLNTALSSLVITGLKDDDLQVKQLALRALSRIDLSSARIQHQLAATWTGAAPQVRRRILAALKETVIQNPELISVLGNELSLEEQALAVEILNVLSRSSRVNDQALKLAYRIAEDKKHFAYQVARDYIQKFGTSPAKPK